MPESPRARTSSWLPVHVAFCVALLLASLDATLGMLGAGEQRMHPALGGLFPIALLIHLGAWTMIGWPLARWRGLQPLPLTIGLGAAILLPGLVLILDGFVDFEAALAARFSRSGQLQLLLLGSVGLLAGIFVERALAAGAFPVTILRTAGRLAPVAAIVALGLAVTVWQHEQARGGSGLRLVEMVPLLTLSIALSFVALRMSSARPLLGALYAAATALLVGPGLLGVPRPSVPEAAAATGGSAVSGPRLVLLVTVDTLRQDALSIYSDQTRSTPGFDALGHEGILFENAFAPAPWTLPSLASIHTGLPETVHGLTPQQPKLPSGLATLAERFAANGYRTVAIGSNPWLELGDVGRGFQTTHFHPETRYRNAGSTYLGDLLGIDEIVDADTEELTDLALAWIRSHRDVPTFLWLHYFDPHSPYEPPAEFLAATHDGPRSFWEPYRVMSGSWQTSASAKSTIRDLYEAEVQYVDRNLTRLMGELKQLGLYEDALIVLTSDHGEEFWDHATGFHGHTLFDEMLRVPLIVKLPADVPTVPRRIGTAVSTGSIGASLLQLSGLEVGDWDAFFPPLPMAASATPDVELRPIVSTGTEYFERRGALILGTHKLIVHLDSDRRELYDLASDPRERRDLAELEPTRVATLSELFAQHVARSDAARHALGLSETEAAALSDEVRAQLESLGYVE